LIFLLAKRDHVQELRGGRLDRERREMSEKRESANADRARTQNKEPQNNLSLARWY
jgi:hypothetical protein